MTPPSTTIRPRCSWLAHPVRSETANARWESGRHAAALKDYQAAIDLYPAYIDTFISRGERDTEIGLYADALRDYTLAVRYQPMSSWGFAERGWLLATCPLAHYRNGSLALADATIICGRTNYKNAKSLKFSAAALAEIGRFEDAVKWQKQALALASDEYKADYREVLVALERGEPYRLPRQRADAVERSDPSQRHACGDARRRSVLSPQSSRSAAIDQSCAAGESLFRATANFANRGKTTLGLPERPSCVECIATLYIMRP